MISRSLLIDATPCIRVKCPSSDSPTAKMRACIHPRKVSLIGLQQQRSADTSAKEQMYTSAKEQMYTYKIRRSCGCIHLQIYMYTSADLYVYIRDIPFEDIQGSFGDIQGFVLIYRSFLPCICVRDFCMKLQYTATRCRTLQRTAI